MCWLLPLASLSTAYAADVFSGSLGITSDYVYRGVSHSSGRLAVQGDLHARLGSSFEIGAWASTLEHPYVDNAVQVDGWVAYRTALTPDWRLQAQIMHTEFIDDPSPLGYDYDEVSVTLSYLSRWSLSATWIPNAARYSYWGPQRNDAFAYDATWLHPVWRSWHVTLGAGYYDVSALYGSGYAYWHAGVLGAVGPFGIELLWIDSQDDAAYLVPAAYRDELTGGRWSASLRWRF